MLTELEIYEEKKKKFFELRGEVKSMEQKLLREWHTNICDISFTNAEIELIGNVLRNLYNKDCLDKVGKIALNKAQLALPKKPYIQ